MACIGVAPISPSPSPSFGSWLMPEALEACAMSMPCVSMSLRMRGGTWGSGSGSGLGLGLGLGLALGLMVRVEDARRHLEGARQPQVVARAVVGGDETAVVVTATHLPSSLGLASAGLGLSKGPS